MTCRRCKSPYDARRHAACPQCGEPRPKPRPVFLKTSSILIATASEKGVYRSLEDVPAALRGQLLKSTNGLNSATILIADRKGREEIARAVRRMPGSQRGVAGAVFGDAVPAGREHLRAIRIAAAVIVLAMMTLCLWIALGRSWN